MNRKVRLLLVTLIVTIFINIPLHTTQSNLPIQPNPPIQTYTHGSGGY